MARWRPAWPLVRLGAGLVLLGAGVAGRVTLQQRSARIRADPDSDAGDGRSAARRGAGRAPPRRADRRDLLRAVGEQAGCLEYRSILRWDQADSPLV